MNAPLPNHVERELFLNAMRNVANSVTVVSTDGDNGISGATVSSFCSVSADPPTLLVCLNKSGSTSTTIHNNGQFCVNVLTELQSEIATLFAKPVDDKTKIFGTTDWQRPVGKSPELHGATSFQCKVSEIVESTSHDIIIGTVTSVSVGNSNPLIYLDRTYRKIG